MKVLRLLGTVAVLVGAPFAYGGIIDSQLGLAARALPGKLELDAVWLSNLVFLTAHLILAGIVAVFTASAAHFVLRWNPFWGALALTVTIFVSKYGILVWHLLTFGDSNFRLVDMSVLAWFMLVAWVTLRIASWRQKNEDR